MRKRRQDLEKRVKFYEDNLLSDSDDGCLQECHKAKAELNQLYNHIRDGPLFFIGGRGVTFFVKRIVRKL